MHQFASRSPEECGVGQIAFHVGTQRGFGIGEKHLPTGDGGIDVHCMPLEMRPDRLSVGGLHNDEDRMTAGESRLQKPGRGVV